MQRFIAICLIFCVSYIFSQKNLTYQKQHQDNLELAEASLLLIHGKADNNSEKHPLQSKYHFNTLKGLGVPIRLVIHTK